MRGRLVRTLVGAAVGGGAGFLYVAAGRVFGPYCTQFAGPVPTMLTFAGVCAFVALVSKE